LCVFSRGGLHNYNGGEKKTGVVLPLTVRQGKKKSGGGGD